MYINEPSVLPKPYPVYWSLNADYIEQSVVMVAGMTDRFAVVGIQAPVRPRRLSRDSLICGGETGLPENSLLFSTCMPCKISLRNTTGI
jgi:hypothetical protein